MTRLHSGLGERTVYTSSGVAAAQGLPCIIYTDPAGTVLANIAVYNPSTPGTPGAAITGAALTVDAYSNRPAFWDLADRDVLYISVNGGPVVPIFPDAQPQIVALSARLDDVAPTEGFATEDDLDAEVAARQAAVSAAITTAAGDASTKADAAQAIASRRENHTGTQPTSSVAGLDGILAAKADLVNGVLPTSQVPTIALVTFLGAVASQAAMLATTGQPGDWVTRTDTSSTWQLTGANPTQLSSWTQYVFPSGGGVSTVNGQPGPTVTISKTDIGLSNVDDVSAASLRDRATHTGTQSADTLTDGGTKVAFLASERIKLAAVASGATANATDSALRDRSTHTGTQSADTVTDGTTNKAYTAVEKTKLAGIPAGATVNASDAQLRDRSTHTGTQPAGTITGLGGAAVLNVGTTSGTVAAGDHTHPAGTPAAHAGSHTAGGSDPVSLTAGQIVSGTIAAARLPIGATAGTVAAGDDPRFSTGGGGGVPTSRIISTTAPLTGGGDLTANRTLGVADATAGSQGVVQLAGDLGGTATAPTVPGLASKASTATQIIAGTGLTGGGTLAANRTLTVAFGTTTGTVAAGDTVAAISTVLGSNVQASYTTVRDRLAAMDSAIASAGGGGPVDTTVLRVTADGATDVAPTIQAVLDGLSASTRPRRILVEGITRGTICINSKVRISTSYTEVGFAAPVLVGPNIDPEGFGGFSILGTTNSNGTVSSGAVRGSSQIVVSTPAGIAQGTIVKINDNEATLGSQAGNKSETARVVQVSGSTLFLDHPLHHTYTGTISLTKIIPVVGSGFNGLTASFTGKQAAAFLFPAKMQNAYLCYFRGMHFNGTPDNSFSRECFSVRDSYRCIVDDCTASMAWNYAARSYSYGFSSDMSTGCIWRNCRTSNMRHGFSADKGSAGLIYVGCIAENTTASGFDLHGGWVRDIIYSACYATGSDTLNSVDGTHCGFLAGNTTFLTGAQYITYIGCVARGFGPYTPNGGSAGSGDGAGFGIVDGSANIVIDSCRVSESQFGAWVLSQGDPANGTANTIRNVTIKNSQFDSIAGGAAAPAIYVNAASSPAGCGVDGFYLRNNEFTNCAGMAQARIYGTSGALITNVVIEGNSWYGAGLAGVYPLDIRFTTEPLVTKNLFFKTRRGVTFTSCTSPSVVGNTFVKLVDGATASMVVLDSGGANTNLLVAENDLIGFVPTGVGTAPSSSGASVTLMPTQRRYATSGRPSAAVTGAGAWYFDTTLGRPVWSDGSAWKDAAGTTV